MKINSVHVQILLIEIIVNIILLYGIYDLLNQYLINYIKNVGAVTD
ncbi:unnamed protein product [Schistosoma curassoni]|uniref:Phosphate-starvation-inducible protein PsiE n=1 Tax=Schistosoma curassoni TaxID=6186 RepID=A0A183K1G7_9TREM|nr:unnamed protein product [Schistosoma curassoni]